MLARELEFVCIKHDCHVALTGGLLYKDGERKDADILIYRNRQSQCIDTIALFADFAKIGFKRSSGAGWIHKFVWRIGMREEAVDVFFPEENLVSEEHLYVPRDGTTEYPS